MLLAIGLGLVLVAALTGLFLTTSAERIAGFLRTGGPAAIIAVGVIFVLLGRGALGLPLIGLGLAALRHMRALAPKRTGPPGDGGSSTVRSRYLEMVLDHASGALDGLVLEGRLAGARLAELSPEVLLELRGEIAGDDDTLRLLEAYLDGRVPGWRDDPDAKGAGGLGGPPGTGAMTEQEAYEILGLQSGATLAEVREAHRRLMKRVHPDQGGTDFLAARINEAKDFLVDRHG